MPDSPVTEPTIAAWRILLRGLGVIFALGIFSFWYAAGQNTGWTKDRIEIQQKDEITGIDYITYKDHFLPGIEFLVAGTGLGLGLSLVTFIRRKTKPSS